MANKKVKALQTFYGTFDEKLKVEGEEFVVTAERAKKLEEDKLAEVLGDSTDEPHKELVINPVGPIAGAPLLAIDNVVNADSIEQKRPGGEPTTKKK